MSASDPRLQGPIDDLRPVLVFLAVSAVLNPLLHLVAIRAYPDEYDSLPVRVAIAVLCGGGLLAARQERTRPLVRQIAILAALVMQGWFLHLGHVNGLSFARVVNAILMVGVTAVVFERTSETLLYLIATLGFLAWAYASPMPSELDPLIAFTTVGVMGAASVVVVQLRARLTQQVQLQARYADALAAEVERRTEAEAAALQSSRSKSTFLANMSHELRTPLNAIIGYSELVLEDVEQPSSKRDLEKVLSAAGHLLLLIDEVLDLARIEAGRLELTLEAVPLRPLVDECLGVVGPAADQGGLELAVVCDGNPVARADRVRTKQIVLNLLSNAVKFTRQGGIEVRVAAVDAVCRVEVVDTGVGIDPERLPHLFAAFETTGGAENPSGTGLGLAIGRELAERMGGGLTARSTPGEGSRFELTLPRMPSAAG